MVGAVVGACPVTVAVTVTPLVGTGLFELSSKPITGDCFKDHLPRASSPTGPAAAVSTMSCVVTPALSVVVFSDASVTPFVGV